MQVMNLLKCFYLFNNFLKSSFDLGIVDVGGSTVLDAAFSNTFFCTDRGINDILGFISLKLKLVF